MYMSNNIWSKEINLAPFKKVYKKALLLFLVYYLIGVIIIIYQLTRPVTCPPCPQPAVCSSCYIPTIQGRLLIFFSKPLAYLLLLGWPLFMYLGLL